MEKKRSLFTSSKDSTKDDVSSKAGSGSTRKAEGDNPSTSSSRTHFFKKDSYEDIYKRITTNEYLGISESMSSSDTFHCVHGSEGKVYSEKGLLKRNLLKELDPIPVERAWTRDCRPAYGWDIAKTLVFLVTDPTKDLQIERIDAHIRDFAEIAQKGYNINVLDKLSLILSYLVENVNRTPKLREGLELSLRNMENPILLNAASDVVSRFDNIREYLAFLSYLLMRLEDDNLFYLVSRGMLYQLSAPDSVRGAGAAKIRHILAAAPILYENIVRMLAVSSSYRFPTFLHIALLLACDSVENCVEMLKLNIIENILCRFNPYYPNRELPPYDINPADPQDLNVQLGDSTQHMSTTLSLLLVLMKTINQLIEENVSFKNIIPAPNSYAQRCFIWAYRYECRAREHRHERTCMTVILSVLVKCFGDKLPNFSSILMQDVFTLSVLTELPPLQDWTSDVSFNTSQADVQFKRILISLCVELLKTFPLNSFIVESRHWLIGLMYLLDPGLCFLRAKWSPSLFAEIRKTALQAIVCTLPLISSTLVRECGLITRIMWYIEWYSESPYELPVLYWCVRVLQAAVSTRGSLGRSDSIQALFDSHGIIILIRLCYTLLEQKVPPVEKSQAIISLCLRLITSALEEARTVSCCVYPEIKWPGSINSLARKMMNSILYSLDKHSIVSDRWLISFLNLVWEGIVWNKQNRAIFLADNGIYKLLDITTIVRPAVQCIALAVLCDLTRAGGGVAQLVTWRAGIRADHASPKLVRQGATIATLLASIFRDDCQATGVKLDSNVIIQDLEYPLMAQTVLEELLEFGAGMHQVSPICYAAADLAGSRLAKVHALLQLLSDDLKHKVELADEAYNLYKNIKLSPVDESTLVLCSHYLTIKLTEVWKETHIQSPGLVPQDEEILQEFLQIGKGWAKNIQLQQQEVIEKCRKKETTEEKTLYEFLGRVRLNIALDALIEVKCVARSADRTRRIHTMLHDAVNVLQKRSAVARNLEQPIIQTYEPKLDEQNITGQYVKVHSIEAKPI